MEHHLTVNENGLLCVKNKEGKVEELFIFFKGDVDRAHWPFGSARYRTGTSEEEAVKDIVKVFSWMFDEGNIGNVEPGKVYLPDGRYFGEIVPCGANVALEFEKVIEEYERKEREERRREYM